MNQFIVEKGNHTGATVALFLDPELAEELAIPGGEKPEDLHITLAYLGDADEIEDQDLLYVTVAKLGQSLAPLRGRLNGLARFNPGPDDDTTPYVILPDLPQLPEFRQIVVDALEKNGFNVSKQHGYIPHITIAYQDDDEPWPAKNVGEREMEIHHISLNIKDERHDFHLDGQFPISKANIFVDADAVKDALIQRGWRPGDKAPVF